MPNNTIPQVSLAFFVHGFKVHQNGKSPGSLTFIPRAKCLLRRNFYSILYIFYNE